MARKPKDLYTVLQARRKVGKGSFSGRASGLRPQSLTEVLANWWASFTGRRRPALKKTDAPTPRGIVLTGPALVAVVFASLGVGFLLGDMIGLGGRSGGPELRASDKGDPETPENRGVRPGPVGTGVRLGDVEETRVLSDEALFLTAYRNDQRSRASATAEWLRGQGVETTRIYMHWGPEGSSHWVVVAYFEGAAPPADLVAKLRDLPGNGDYPEFDEQRKSVERWPPVVAIR